MKTHISLAGFHKRFELLFRNRLWGEGFPPIVAHPPARTRQHPSGQPHTKPLPKPSRPSKTSQHLPHAFFARPAELVAPELIGCLLVKQQMLAKMAIGSEVFGSCVGEIYVSVEQKNVVVWLRCGLNYLRFILAGKAAQYLGWWWAVVPGIGGCLMLLEFLKK